MLTRILKGKAMEPDQRETSTEKDMPAPKPAGSEAGKERPRETGGPKGPEPTRYQDWERGGRCIDF
jgi:hypothetical protein